MKGLRRARLNTGDSIEKLAELTGVTPANFSLIERGLQTPSTVTRLKLERYFGQRLNWLDSPKLEIEPRDPPSDWIETEREFRSFMRSLASLSYTQRKYFVHSAIKHMKLINKNK